jgi:hypothetical protein
LVKSIECFTPETIPPTDLEIILLFHVFCMSPKEAKRTFLIPGRGFDDV